jgi:hypothetical protein
LMKAPGFNPWSLKCDLLVAKFALKFNVLYRYAEALSDTFARMLACHGFVHGDPHPVGGCTS